MHTGAGKGPVLAQANLKGLDGAVSYLLMGVPIQHMCGFLWHRPQWYIIPAFRYICAGQLNRRRRDTGQRVMGCIAPAPKGMILTSISFR
jgi:hypothetical protein